MGGEIEFFEKEQGHTVGKALLNGFEIVLRGL